MGRGLVSMWSDEQSPSFVWQGPESSAAQTLHPAIRPIQTLVRSTPELSLFQAKQSHLSALLSSEMCQSFNHLCGPYVRYDLVYQSEHHD